ncbi:hypothetical protein TNCV_262771 [Trichonephila clavipes]|nr:hypothetical protein TNCV_262771 [Trichonephila clavipes]
MTMKPFSVKEPRFMLMRIAIQSQVKREVGKDGDCYHTESREVSGENCRVTPSFYVHKFLQLTSCVVLVKMDKLEYRVVITFFVSGGLTSKEIHLKLRNGDSAP